MGTDQAVIIYKKHQIFVNELLIANVLKNMEL